MSDKIYMSIEEMEKDDKEMAKEASSDCKECVYYNPGDGCEHTLCMYLDNEEEMVQHPNHYNNGKYEVIDVIDDWKLGFYEGNIIKYVARAKHKGKELEDLKKAKFYLDRLVYKFEGEE